MILNAELIRESEENAVKSGAFSLKELMPVSYTHLAPFRTEKRRA